MFHVSFGQAILDDRNRLALTLHDEILLFGTQRHRGKGACQKKNRQ
jgi:hypothetical protein